MSGAASSTRPGHRRIIALHGFTQTARSWTPIASRRSRSADAFVALDLPGHGTSTEPVGDLWDQGRHVVEMGGAGCYVGYSLGGRVALHASIARPDAVHRLVLVSTTAGIDDPAERAARRAADDALADHLESVGVDTFVDEWLANPLFAGLDAETDQRDDRRRNTAAGLAESLRRAGTGTQEPLWSRLGGIEVPVLVVVGELDEKFRALGERLCAGFPDAVLAVVPGAGHSVHMEQPDRFVRVLDDWLG